MHREGEDARLVGKDVGGAVALMDVEIDDQHASDEPLGEQQRGRDADIVEGAEPRALAAPGMMAAAGGVAGESRGERQPGGHDGACRGQAGAAATRSPTGKPISRSIAGSTRHARTWPT